MPTRRITQSIQTGDQTLVGSVSLTAAAAVSIDEAVAGGGSPVTLNQAIDVSALTAIFVTAETSSMSLNFAGPDVDIDVDAGRSWLWITNSGFANPFGSTDVTSISVSNNEATAGRIKIELLIDPTP